MNDTPNTPPPSDADVAVCRPIQSLRASPPMAEWVTIDERDLRTSFRVAVTLEIGKLPQLKGKGSLRDTTERDKEIAGFADRLLERLVASNMQFARGPTGPGSTNARPRRDGTQ